MPDVIQRADQLRFRLGIGHPDARYLCTAIAAAKNKRGYASALLEQLQRARREIELAARRNTELAALWPGLAEALDRDIAKALIPGVGCEFCKTGCPVCQDMPAVQPGAAPPVSDVPFMVANPMTGEPPQTQQ